MTCTLCGSTQHTAPNCKWRNTCASCTHASASSKSPEGLIVCRAERRSYAYKSPSTERLCARRINADDDVTKKRISWIEGRA